jgi:hypothetical protein
MDDRLKAILESVPKKHPRSKLEPFTELIRQLRRRGHTYRGIARILTEKCDMVVASSTVVRFAATLARNKRKYSKHPDRTKSRSEVPPIVEVNVTSAALDANLWKRIEALKKQPAKIANSSKQFQYDPDQPLQLSRKK